MLYTKNGRPLRVTGDLVHSRSGALVGRVNGDKVFAPDGRYVGTISEGRLVFRHSESAGSRGRFTAANTAKFSSGDVAHASMNGDEPNIPD